MAGKFRINPITGKMDLVGGAEGLAAIEDKPALNGLLVTLDDNGTEKQYIVARDEYVAPADPIMTAGNTQQNPAIGSKVVSISCATAGATIRYTTDGSDPTASSPVYTGAITLNQSADVEVREVSVKAVAYKNGIASDIVSTTYYIARQVATPVISKSGSKIAISCATTGASIYYTTDGSTPTASSTLYDDSNKPDIAFKTIKAIAILSNWANSNAASKNVCYIGQAATLTAEAGIYALANAYLQDTFTIGETKSLDFGSTAQYVWICVPNTAARNMSIKSGGFDVPLQSASGAIVGDYRVWRSEATLKETFDFNFIS